MSVREYLVPLLKQNPNGTISQIGMNKYRMGVPDADWEATRQQAMNQSTRCIETHTCNCIGPRNGEPLCRCMMSDVVIIDGRYVKISDLGPAPTDDAA